ncbi:hypothetical protein GCM10017708_38520 [Arthrobacter citreus]
MLTAAAVGAGLAVSGAVMQALTRNALADPYLLGLSSGASLGAVCVVLLGLQLLLPVAAFIGALAALAATLLLARLAGGLTPSRTVLAGVAVSSLGSALTSLVIFWTATGDSYRNILGWLLGSLSGAQWFSAGLPPLRCWWWACRCWRRPGSWTVSRSATTPPRLWASMCRRCGGPCWPARLC